MTASDSPATPDLEPRIRAEQVRTAFGAPPANVRSTVLPNIVVGLGMAWIMLDDVAPALVGGWFGILLAFQLTVPRIMMRRFWAGGDSVAAAPRWGRLFALQATANGLIWGCGAALFLPAASPVHLALLCAILCGMAAGAIPVTSMLLPAFYGAVTSMLLPLALRAAASGDPLLLTLSGLIVVYWAFNLSVGHAHNRLFRDSFRQRLENAELVARLREQTVLAEAAKDEAVRADRAKSKFLAAASHDLRQPLHAATLFCSALLKSDDPVEARRLGGQLSASVEALGRLLGGLLDVSRLDAGAVTVRLQPFELESLFARLRHEFGQIAREKGLRFRLWPTVAIAHTDPVLFEQALRNLIANAIRYTGRGSVAVVCRRRGGQWRVEVRDSGVGIAREEQRNILAEFYQVGNRERDRSMGLGLGLAIVDRVTRLLDCALDIRSAPGRGSVFALTVPAAAAAPAEPTEVAPAAADLAGLRVLIVDDEAEILDAMQAVLRQWHCDVVAALSLDDALRRLAAGDWRPDVAVSDLRLRGATDGIAVLDGLRRRFGAELPCVVVTGEIGAGQLQAMRESGYPVLHKPVRPARLRALLSQFRLDGASQAA